MSRAVINSSRRLFVASSGASDERLSSREANASSGRRRKRSLQTDPRRIHEGASDEKQPI
jgi:hypothetical protein